MAFTVVIKKDGSGNLDEDTEKEEALVDVTHHAVTGAVQDVSSDPECCCRCASVAERADKQV